MKSPWQPLPIKKLRSVEVNATYEDDSEKFLSEFFNKPQSQKQSEILRLLETTNSWPIQYQLSEQRQHLLDWFTFDKSKSLIDIGAGCGALTGLFADRVKHVTCLELTLSRAEVISRRWADKNNVEIWNASFDDAIGKDKFDYVNVTGVLEYAGMFTNNPGDHTNFNNAAAEMLAKLNSLLSKDGQLLLAIENAIGLRYLSGAVEDHYGKLFTGVEGYLDYNGIQTFSLYKLKQLLLQTGFSKIEVYFPFPDYKLPTLILSENYLETNQNVSLSSLFLNKEHANVPLYQLFSEVGLASQLLNEKILSHFAPSFLIIAQKD